MITKGRIEAYQMYSRVVQKKWDQNKIDSESLDVYLPELNDILALALKGLEVDKLKAVIKKAVDVIGDGNNGPPQFYAEIFEELEESIKDKV